MRSTLLISESYYGTSKKVADILSLILGPAKHVEIDEELPEVSKYNNIVLVLGFYGFNTADKLKKYLSSIKDIIKNKRIAIVGVGLLENYINNDVLSIEKAMNREADIINFVQGEIRVEKLTKDDKKILKAFLKEKRIPLTDMGSLNKKEILDIGSKLAKVLNKPDKEMNKKELKDEINKFIEINNTCTLATGSGDFVRNTPIEYTYYKDKFYFISEGGFKFKGILQNSNVCLAIFDSYTSMNELKGMQISGESEIIPCWSEEYIELIKVKGLNIETLKNLSVNLNLIKVVPSVFEFLNTDFKAKGMDSKQYYFVN
ncbi:hypothetical protein psyc5s11_37230 [Clostridium gelidum]|uniref:Flavodoxin domain-containing protein n=1 Tax=Clostridium gelidum TaxID=704125 RepID=A0ABN6J3S7_9CLOT|nr:flavodoxin domain-containing protein [Clostridium gelidum]BCZ47656.1 hypothetical protein psyc5s11_37230 [Clostridium gelidum]